MFGALAAAGDDEQRQRWIEAKGVLRCTALHLYGIQDSVAYRVAYQQRLLRREVAQGVLK